MKRIQNKYLRWSLNLILATYFFSYILLSANGRYHGPYQSVTARATDGALVMRQQFIWEPLHARLDRFGFNWSGAVYSPLILLDRLIWHRDKLVQLEP